MNGKNIIKRILRNITDDSQDRAERTFNMLVLLGLVGLGVAAILSAIFNETTNNIVFMGIIWIVFFLVYLLSVNFHKTKLAINLTTIILTLVFVPVNFFQVGGFFSGSVPLFIFAIAYICLVVESKIKYLYLAANCVIMFLSCYFQYFHPEFERDFTRRMLASDMLISVSIVAVVLSTMILFHISIFKAENAKSMQQKKEIEDLNLAQNRFFSSMSHEIRTPINTIIGLNEMILREADTSDETAENARAMQSAGRMLLSLVNDILDLSKIDAGKMEIVTAPYSTGDMLSELVNMMWFTAKNKGLTLHINVDGKIPARLVGDETRVKQVLINILNNAVKYTQKGSVTLSVQCEKSASNASAVNMVYSIVDTGIGIKQESIPHLFSVFKRVDLEKTHHIEGTGLGLSIVKQLLELMDGTVEVNSVYTQGSTFIVKIPQGVEGSEEIDDSNIKARHSIRRERKAAASFTAPDARVLIVDDNEANLMVAEKLLRETEAKITTVTSAAECLKNTQSERYDMIFMDHLMPGMDGIECLHEVRRQHDGLNQDTPIVVLTANAGGDYRQLYLREGFDGILVKPITGRQLEDELLAHLPADIVKSSGKSEINEVLESPFHTGIRKMPLMIAADGSLDIPLELAQNNNIAILPSSVETDGGVFVDGVEIDQNGLMRYFAETGKKAASLDHTTREFLAFFADCLAKAQHLIYVSVSAGIVKNFDIAKEAARSFASVTVFDTQQASSGQGIMALKAAELAKQGVEEGEILGELERLKENVQTSFIVDNTKHLLGAGRMPKLVCKICDSLALHPILLIKEGRMTIGSIKIGSEGVFWKKYIKWALRKPWTIDKSVAFVTYAGVERHRLREIEKEVQKTVAFERVYFQKASASVSANCGPGTFGVIFVRKQLAELE